MNAVHKGSFHSSWLRLQTIEVLNLVVCKLIVLTFTVGQEIVWIAALITQLMLKDASLIKLGLSMKC